MSEQMYAVPVSPWALNTTQLDRKRSVWAEAEMAAAKATDQTEKSGLSQHAKSLQRELATAENEMRLEQQRAAMARNAASNATNSMVQDSEGEPQFMPTVAYFERQTQKQEHPETAEAVVANRASAAVSPEFVFNALPFSQQHAVMEKAIAEVKRLKLAS